MCVSGECLKVVFSPLSTTDGKDRWGRYVGESGIYITLPEEKEIFQYHGMVIEVEFLSLIQVRAGELTGIRTVNSGNQDTQQGIFGTSTKCRLASVLGNGHSTVKDQIDRDKSLCSQNDLSFRIALKLI